MSLPGAPLEPETDLLDATFIEDDDVHAPLGANVESSIYEDDEATDDEADEEYEKSEENEYTAEEWEAWEASHDVHEHDTNPDHQL
ncbi:hypothetical protein CYMTET_23731 [Cymbomonas tetramitiformis]|uniref:Uncharacterized protein n=1 Tax=Cymbomonas tetramitiformis TaxID=36881 RepID=A0AAE0FXX1_9CHLO|nr:hypothetical protein CYMTET_23731 [Cymbomonas tetramitiformis]